MSGGRQEAERLASTIRAYWKARGLSPLVWVERQRATASATDDRAAYVVRSDMVGGQPKAGPCTARDLAGDSKSSPPSPIQPKPGMGQRINRIESHRPPKAIWRDVGMAVL
jgi:hypothetical protein